MSGLVDVLAEHAATPANRKSARGSIVQYERACQCGEPMPWAEPELGDAHRAHIAAAVEAWLAERLATDEVREAVARAIHGNTIGDPAKGQPIVIADRKTRDIIRDTDAALAAITAALTQGDRR